MKNQIFTISKKYGDQIGIDLPYLIKNGFWVFLRQLFAAFGGFAVYIVFARYADQEVFGNYQLVLSILAIMGITALPGMSPALIQASVQGNDGAYRRSFQLSLLGSFFGSAILFLIGTYFFMERKDFGLTIMISSAFFPFLTTFGLWDGFLQGKERFDVIAKFSSLLAVMQAIFVSISILVFPDNLVAAVIAYLASLSLLNVIVYRRSLAFISNDRPDEESVKFGFFMTKMSVLGVVAEQIDKLLVGALLGPTNLAIYTVVSFLGVKIKDLVRSMSSMLIPKMIVDTLTFRELIGHHRKVLSIGAIVIFTAGLLFVYFISSINEFVFSDRYADHFNLSRFYVVTFVLSVPLTLLGYYVYAKRNTYSLSLSNTAYHVFRIGLNVYAIYFYGLLGAVMAYNVSMIFLLLIYVWSIYHEEKVISVPR